MTTNHDETEFAAIDGYITGQLGQAAAELAGDVGTRARLEAVLRARSPGRTPSGAVEVGDDG